MHRYRPLSTSSRSKANICRQILCKFLQITFITGTFVFFIYLLARHQKVPTQFTSLQVWYKTEQKIKRPTYINRDHGYCGPCPSDKHFSNAWQLTDLVTLISPSVPFIVNIGAASTGGGVYDPIYPVLTATNSSFGALLIDPNTDPSLVNAYPQRNNIHIIHDFIWAESIVENIFEKYKISKDFTILKVDVDSYECSLLEAILQAGYRPQLIHTEFNPVFPPPVIFIPTYNSVTKNDWKPSLWSNFGPFYGCSLSALSKILRAFDYIVVEVEFWDVIYIQRELAESFHIQVPANDIVAYQHGFLNHLCLPYCRQNVKLYNNRIENVIKFAMNQSNFTASMINVMDSIAPISMKNNLTHPYIITL